MVRQQTIKNPVQVSGRGLHTGCNVNVTLKPSAENSGVAFLRTDIENAPIIKADVYNVSDTSRGTTLEVEGVKVYTVEHLLSALQGLKIDNVLVELDGQEIPILDGSARPWVEGILLAGIVEQTAERKFYKISKNTFYKDDVNEIEMLALPSDDFRVTVVVDYKTKVFGLQMAEMKKWEDYVTEIAPCRTFVFLHELEFLQKNNLIKGGDIDNALVFVDKVLEQEELNRIAKLFNKHIEDLKVEEGILNNISKHFENEPARHKLMDFIGDISLVGLPLKGHFIVKRPGHKSNVAFAKLIREQMMENKNGVPTYDPNQPPVYDINKIRDFLPHRYPFLLVDKIIEVGEDYVVGVKNVTVNEPFFTGHFPNEPVMPGVLLVEAMGQTGGILVLKDISDPENYSTYFAKFENVRFRNKVVPGDTVLFKLELTAPIKRGIVQMKGVGYVGDKIVIEANLVAQIAKNN